MLHLSPKDILKANRLDLVSSEVGNRWSGIKICTDIILLAYLSNKLMTNYEATDLVLHGYIWLGVTTLMQFTNLVSKLNPSMKKGCKSIVWVYFCFLMIMSIIYTFRFTIGFSEGTNRVRTILKTPEIETSEEAINIDLKDES